MKVWLVPPTTFTGPTGDIVPLAPALVVIVKVGAPDWVIVKVFPAIVRVAGRVAVVVFAATVKLTVPSPVPDLPDVIVVQLGEADALQLQALSVVTEEVPLPPV